MMGNKIILSALLSILVQVSGWSDTYRGAVVEYHPDLDVTKNVNNYINYIKMAKKKGSDIIVFPEGGLGTVTPSPIPDPSDHIVPCDNSIFETTKVVKDLSCASKENKIYSVVNLLEKRKCSSDDSVCASSEFYIFNTNVVFDRTGMVIARYAKYNLFDEHNVNRTEDPEIVFFDTDFGVRFGTFICFDILFSAPAQRLVRQYQIKDFVYTTYWFSELPFLTALQMQRGWAEANNVNLLASGVNNPFRGSGGSGIYNGKYGHIVQVMPETETSKLLIADVPRIKYNNNADSCERKTHTLSRISGIVDDYYNTTNASAMVVEKEKIKVEPNFNLLGDQIHLYTSEVINAGRTFEQTVCSRNDFCCDFHVDMNALKPESANYTYRAMAFNGVRYFGQKTRGGVQSCGIVLCDGPHIQNCTNRVKNTPGLFRFNSIRIKGSFNLRNSFQMPCTLTDGEQLKPLEANKYEFVSKENNLKSEVSLELLWRVNNLHTFAIWGRDFSRDMEPDYPIAGASSVVSIPAMLASFIFFILVVH